MPSASSTLEPERSPRQVRRGKLLRWALVIGAVAQLAVAIAITVAPGADSARHRQIVVVAPADAVTGVSAAAATTTTLPPVVVEAPTTTAAPAQAVVSPGAVAGVIGAGPGGKARADLLDEAGNVWHSEADSRGGYRFDNLPPGRYQLILAAESAPAPCPPEGPCVGSAMAISKRIIEIKPGQEVREDYPMYGPTGPAAPTTTVLPTTTTTAAPTPSSTTSTTTR